MSNQPTPTPQQAPKQQQLPRPRPGPPPTNKFLQHVNPQNKQFNSKPFTEEDHDRIQTKLNKVLHKSYISERDGGGSGKKVPYIEGWKALNLANEIFGFDGWNSEIISCNVDYLDTHGGTGKFSLGLSMVVRVTLRDGTFHEDIGYGCVDNCAKKSMAFEKCKKEALTDGIKRCLRCFGHVLGNCLYDKNFISQVKTLKHRPIVYEPEDFHCDPLLIERERKRKKIEEEYEKAMKLQEQNAVMEEEAEDMVMRVKHGVTNPQPPQQQQQQQQQQQPQPQMNGVQQVNLQHHANGQQQLNSNQQAQQPRQIRVDSSNQPNGNYSRQPIPQPRVQPTNQNMQINQQRQPRNINQQQQQQQQVDQSSLIPSVGPNSSALVTPRSPNKHIDYVPTSKEADELDDSFLFSDDLPDQHGHHSSPRDNQQDQPVQHVSKTNKTSSTEVGPHDSYVTEQEKMPENALTAFVAAGSANLLQEGSTNPNEIPRFDPTFISPNIRRTVDPTKSVKTKRNESPSPLSVNVNNHMVSKPLHNPLHSNMGKRVGMPPQPRQSRRPQLEGSPQPVQQLASNVIYPPPASIAANSIVRSETRSANK